MRSNNADVRDKSSFILPDFANGSKITKLMLLKVAHTSYLGRRASCGGEGDGGKREKAYWEGRERA